MADNRSRIARGTSSEMWAESRQGASMDPPAEAPGEREAPRCATCGGVREVWSCDHCETVYDIDNFDDPISPECPERCGLLLDRATCPDCPSRSEADGGLLGALRRGYVRDEDRALIDKLRERLKTLIRAAPATEEWDDAFDWIGENLTTTETRFGEEEDE